MTKPAKLKIARTVTRRQAEIFVEVWLDALFDGDGVWEAFERTGLVTWPDDEAGQQRYEAIEREICERTFRALKPALAEEFLEAAADVLQRERRLGTPGVR